MRIVHPTWSRALIGSALALVFAVALGATGAAQTITGRISGTVTDASGGVLPGVEVVVTNEGTGLKRNDTTNSEGFFVVTNLPVGPYSVQVEHAGFKKALKTGYNLVADGRLTVDFALETGAVSESVSVVASAGETVNTTSGEVARVIDGKQVQNLALNGRQFIQLASLIPGAALLSDDPLSLITSLNVNGAQAINGNRTVTTSITIDGGNNLDSGSNNSIVNNVGIDFLQEVKIQTSNFSAEYGRNSGGAINLVTRSGTNEYHGSVWEFFRNDALDARSFFAPRKGKLRYNNFGWAIGGPIKKDKLFFFAGEEWRYIRQDSAVTRVTLPTRAERAGNFAGRSGTLNLPGTSTPVPNRDISSLITPNGKAIAEVYNQMEKLASSYVDTPTANNATFQQPNPFDYREDIVRVDYHFNDRHTLYGRYIHDKYDLIDPFGTFINSQLPTIPTNRLRPGYGIQIGYTWLISPQLINEAKLSTSWNGQRIPPFGNFWQRASYGFTFPQLFSGGKYDNGIADTTISGFASFNGPSGSLLSPTTDIAASDNVTITRGAHTIKAGGIYVRNRKDQNGRTGYTGVVAFNASGNTKTTGNAFADALIGNFRTYSEFNDDPIGHFRFSQAELFVSDSWKASRKLSLEIGARLVFEQPIYTQANNIVNFNPGLYDPSQAVTVLANGTLVPNSGNRFNGLIRAGDGVPSDQLGRVPNGNSPAVLAVPAGAQRGLYHSQFALAPRLGFAYTPFDDNKTSIRGGFGIFYDRPQGNIIYSSLNIAPFVQSSQFENGNLTNPSGGTASALAPFGTINTIDPNLKMPYTMNYSLSIQHELPHGFFVEASYVGNLGRHLLRQPDINQASFTALALNAALPTAQRLSVNALRPYKGYSQIREFISDSTSNYNSLQLYLTKRLGDLQLTSSYTYSHSLADTSNDTDNPESPFDRGYSYGPTSFDRRHVFVSTANYALPFLRDHHGVVGMVLGGWEASGILRLQTGPYVTLTGDTSIGNRRADFVGGDIYNVPSGQGPAAWFNVLAFRQAPDTRLGNSAVGVIEGPALKLLDLSARKRFAVTERFNLTFQADFFNAVNHGNLRAPATNLGTIDATTGKPTNTTFGTITASGPGRNIQLALKLNF